MIENDRSNGDGDSGRARLEIVFSLADGFAWVSWPGTDAMMRLGAYETVTAGMRDFLAQGEVGERLTRIGSQ
ncbi:MAG TPA: hypothetical protein VIT45_04965 [Allosphingosinicella sp.]